jgi:signal transduction histidine kinase
MNDNLNKKSFNTDVFSGGGKMGEYVRSKDWSKTPLGPIEQWPQSLKTIVGLCLASNFPISIAWGPHRVQIYNDGYWPICGDKHPQAMGQDYKECWAAAWPVIGEAFEAASKGQTQFLTNQRMFLNRFGYMEETFFTFNFTPIFDESGGVGGLFHPVTELTQQSLGERRLDLLRNIGTRTMKVNTLKETIALLMDIFSESELDIPFSHFYLLNNDANEARLIASSGIKAETTASLSPKTINLLNTPDTTWPLAKVLESRRPFLVGDLSKIFGSIQCGPYEEEPRSAFVFPVELPNLPNVFGFFVAGVSSRRILDEPYRTFYDLLNSAVSNALTKAKANEDEGKRIEALMELDKTKTAFFSNISHEFRTPLMLMLGSIDGLLHDENNPLKKVQKEQMLMLQRNALRLQRLVNNLLDFSKIEAGRMEAKYYATNISAFTAELASSFRSVMEKAGLQFTIDCKPISKEVYIDHEMWEKIVFNLLSNALKFTFSGSISVVLTEEQNGIMLKINDTGEGISKEGLGNLFKRFHRIQGAKSRSYEGSGLGLAFVRDLVRLHGGTVSVNSEVKKGSTFTVQIPFGKEHLPAEKVMDKKAQQKISDGVHVFLNESEEWVDKNTMLDEIVAIDKTNHSGNKSLLLLVDDNADVLEYVSRILMQNEDWEIAKASNGVEALTFMDKRTPSLILSDVMMPEMDGFELLKRIRSNVLTSRIPVILLSARAGEDASIEGLEKGADDYLVKPFSAKELYARVKNQLMMLEMRTDNKELLQRLKNRTKEMEQMTYIASHDLQQPLNTIFSMINMLEEDYSILLDEDGLLYLKYAKDSAVSMRELIICLLDYSQLEKVKKIEYVNCNEILNTVKTNLYSLITEKKAIVEVGQLPELYAYPFKLSLLFQNLINNAIKFQNPNRVAKIIVSARELENAWEFSVKDNGIGIEERNFEKIFQLFQRLHSKKEYEGTGIGLTHCKKIVELHHGKIWLESEQNVGSTFFFTIKKNLDKQLVKEI